MDAEKAELLNIIQSLSARCAQLAKEKEEQRAHFEAALKNRKPEGDK